MKKYRVRMEFDIDSVDFGDITIEANSPGEAREIALKKYLSSESLDIDYYSSNAYNSSIRSEDINEWLVEEE